jgi:hypothetical protein
VLEVGNQFAYDKKDFEMGGKHDADMLRYQDKTELAFTKVKCLAHALAP